MKNLVILVCLALLANTIALAGGSKYFKKAVAAIERKARVTANGNKNHTPEEQEMIKELIKRIRYPKSKSLKRAIVGFESGDRKLTIAIESHEGKNKNYKIEEYFIPFDRVNFQVMKDLTGEKRDRKGHFLFHCRYGKPEIRKLTVIDLGYKILQKNEHLKTLKLTFGKLYKREVRHIKGRGRRKSKTTVRYIRSGLSKWLDKLYLVAKEVQLYVNTKEQKVDKNSKG